MGRPMPVLVPSGSVVFDLRVHPFPVPPCTDLDAVPTRPCFNHGMLGVGQEVDEDLMKGPSTPSHGERGFSCFQMELRFVGGGLPKQFLQLALDLLLGGIHEEKLGRDLDRTGFEGAASPI